MSNDIIQALKVLYIDGRIDADPGVQQVLNVLPSLGVSYPGGVGVRKFIDKMRLTDSFTLLSGKSESIREVAAALGINYKKLDNGEYSHSSLFTLLSPNGEIILQHAGLSVSVDNFKAKIKP